MSSAIDCAGNPHYPLIDTASIYQLEVTQKDRITIGSIDLFQFICVVSSCAWFYSRRNLLLIRQRKHWLVIAQSLGLMIYSIVSNFSFMFEYTPCYAIVVFHPFVIYLPMTVFFLRIASIAVSFETEPAKVEHVRPVRKGQRKRSWWIRNKSWFTEENYCKVLTILVLVECLAHVIIALIHIGLLELPRINLSCRELTNLNSKFMYGIIVLNLGVIAFLIVRFRLFDSQVRKECLGLRQEFGWIIVCAAIAFGFNFPLFMSVSVQKSAFFGFCNAFGINGYAITFQTFPELLIALVSTLLPVWLTYQKPKKSKPRSDSLQNTGSMELKGTQRRKARDNYRELSELLSVEEGFELFKERLQEEFSVENILFWQDVNRYKKGEVTAQFIFENYIPLSAPLCVNLSAKVRKCLEAKFDPSKVVERMSQASCVDSDKLLSPVELDEFDAAQGEIFDLLVRDSFLRFRATPKYEEFRSKNLTVDPANWSFVEDKQ
jgi:hypothetical protein